MIKIKIPRLLEVTKKDKDSFWVSGDLILEYNYFNLGHYDKWVYFVLCERAGRLADKDGYLIISIDDLVKVSGISRETIWRARRNLVKANLIEER